MHYGGKAHLLVNYAVVNIQGRIVFNFESDVEKSDTRSKLPHQCFRLTADQITSDKSQ